MRNSQLIFVLLLGAITGCGLPQREAEPKNTFLLDLKDPPASAPAWTAGLQLHACRAHAPVADKPLLYRLSRVRYERDFFNTFLVSPTVQIDALLSRRWHQGSPGTVREERWVLRPTLEQLWGDFTDPNQAQARVQLHFLLTDLSSQEPGERVILSERFQAAQDLPSTPRADDVVEAFSVCLERLLEAFENRVNNKLAAEAKNS